MRHRFVVALEGIEPTRPVGHRSLNPARLPCFATGPRCLEMVGSDPVPGTDQLASPVPHRGPKPTQGIEPRGEGTVLCPCPPSWAPRADDGHRTRDIHFGRVTLCQLSYIRICPEMLHRRGQSVLRCGRLAVHLTPIGAAATPQPVLTPEESASQVGADWWSVAALRTRTQYPAPPAGTCADLLHRTSRCVRPRGLEPRTP